ncbi:unnamed protein product [Cladocopium goreaui]|uniref:Uncharacterized protein n=1 Tax=Cladocopium goreaui TaxID=2562237 RepID=A0A9P1BTB9_9DINO|nr:unnamed protein product [Cladocopium goreaui]
MDASVFEGDAHLEQLMTYFDTVVASKNLGQHLQDVFGDDDKMDKAIFHYVLDGASIPASKAPLNLIPVDSMEEFWLPLNKFNFGPDSKNGFYPSNQQYAAHFGEFLLRGYKPAMGTIDCKFPFRDSTRAIKDGSVGIVDGFTKVLIMLAIVGFLVELEVNRDDLNGTRLGESLKSFAAIRCTYQHYDNPSHHFLLSLKLGYVTAEKISPSPISMLADIQQAINIERKMNKSNKALKDIMARVVSDYNKMVSIKRHKIDGARRNLIYNLLRLPQACLDLLHKHYDGYRHEQSGLPHDVLTHDFFVPGSTTRKDCDIYKGKELFSTILTTSPETCATYFKRAIEDFCRRAGQSATVKKKKQSQISEDEHFLLHDVCCLWLWVKQKMAESFTVTEVEKHQELFDKGHLDSDLSAILKSGEPPVFERIPFILEAQGKMMIDYVASHQDRSKNALLKSIEATYLAWVEDLRADEAQFVSDRILMEKEGQKTRNRLIKQLEDCHNRAWEAVAEFMGQNLAVFAGKVAEGESTVMPKSRSWLRETIQENANSQDDHSICLWMNCTTIGILGAHHKNFIYNYVANVLADYPLNGICFLVFPNRAGMQDVTSRKRPKAEEDDPDVKGGDDSDEDEHGLKKEEPKDDDSKEAEAVEVRDIRYAIEKEFAMKERNLRVRNLTWIFDPDTVYGKRDGVVTGLAIVNRDSRNLFRSTRGFKTGTVHQVKMHPRSQMFKPEQASPGRLPHLGRAFTDVQELKQVAAGTHFIKATLGAFGIPTSKLTLLVDLFGYDAFPALTCIEASGSDLATRVGNQLYELGRAGSIKIPSFPDFTPHLEGLKAGAITERTQPFKVTAVRGNNLMVLDSFAKRTAGSAEDDDAERPAKKLKLETCSELDVSKIPNVQTLQINNTCDLIVGGDTMEKVYLSSRSKNQFLDKRELFSMGPGEWRDGQEAAEVLQDVEGRWFSFNVNKQSLIILEKKSLPQHLMEMESLEMAISLQALMVDMQDLGEVKVDVSHHTFNETMGDWVNSKQLVFVMDEFVAPDSGKKGKEKKSKKKPDLQELWLGLVCLCHEVVQVGLHCLAMQDRLQC